MNKLIFSLIVGAMIAVMAQVYSDSVTADISDNVVRLHIIANSESEEDQKIKLSVRDEIIRAQKNGEITSLSDIAEIAGEVLADNGFGYGAIASEGKYYFPTKYYKNIKMPAGVYNAVRITLGEGIGRNWWCVMYPPLCFTEECSGEMSDEGMDILTDGIQKESADIITGSGAEIEMKFKIVETVQEIRQKYFS